VFTRSRQFRALCDVS